MKALLDAHKYETRLIGKIQEDLLSQHGDEGDRDMTMLHPSEMAKADWCPRQSYYRLAKVEPDSGAKEDAFSWVLENVFNEGHDSHTKWQARVNNLNRLRGDWRCVHCNLRFQATSPDMCPKCMSPAVEYREVPLRSDEYMIIGHADGDVDEGNEDIANDPLLEVKTIGVGTLRFEAPGFLADNTHAVEINGETKNVIDYDGLWRAIKRPFPSHLRQGMLYLALTGRKTMVYIYDCKWNQQVKEFVIRYRPELVEPLLDQALDVKYALKVGKPVDRPGWAEPDCKTCNACPYRMTCWETFNADDQPRPPTDPRRREAAPERRSGDAPDRPEAEVRPARGPAAPGRVVRRRPHGPVRRVDPVD
jgi:rubrerythrin